MTADDVIATLGLAPHPEGGHYRETWKAEAHGDARPLGTSIYFLLRAGERSHWHTVDAAEMWFWHAGYPLELRVSVGDAGPAEVHLLGPDLGVMRPQALVPVGAWQAARLPGDAPKDAWALVSCTVTPGFRFEGFVLADPRFDIPDA
jgi:hypothetical protein